MNGNALGGFLVWVTGLKGPAPQKWSEHPSRIAVSDYWKEQGGRILAIHALTPELYALDLDDLRDRFPAPQIVEAIAS